MSYTRHHAILVTSWNQGLIEQAHQQAQTLFEGVSPITRSLINDYRTFLIPPDGSYEGWSLSDRGDERRNQFIDCLNQMRFQDGSTPFDWVEVQYGDANGQTKITRHADQPHYQKAGVLP